MDPSDPSSIVALLPGRVRSINKKVDPVLQHPINPRFEVALPPARPRKRKVRPDEESSDSDEEKGPGGKRKGGKVDSSKGLRALTRQVCDKVKSKRLTTYREVANELVSEATAASVSTEDGPTGESKTVRRRVYDALNVLMAMGIIVREKKEIRWVGLPNAREELEALQVEKSERERRIVEKRELLKELEAQKKLYRNLVYRNIQQEAQTANDLEALTGGVSERITLPFLIIQTKAGTDIACEMTDDRTQYTFNFSTPFEIHQETQIIRDMSLPDTTLEDDSLIALSHTQLLPASVSSSSSGPVPDVVPKREFTDGHYTRSHAYR